MIVVTTPTGNVGSQLLAELLNAETESLRVIVRDPSRLDDAVRDQVQVIVGSHADPAVLDQALDGAQGLFWLVPPSMRASLPGRSCRRDLQRGMELAASGGPAVRSPRDGC